MFDIYTCIYKYGTLIILIPQDLLIDDLKI